MYGIYCLKNAGMRYVCSMTAVSALSQFLLNCLLSFVRDLKTAQW